MPIKDALRRLWKGEPHCEAEMKIGVQVFRDVHCQLSNGHDGRHRANVLTSWPARPEEKRGLQEPQRDDL